jgi:hypothetical protein
MAEQANKSSHRSPPYTPRLFERFLSKTNWPLELCARLKSLGSPHPFSCYLRPPAPCRQQSACDRLCLRPDRLNCGDRSLVIAYCRTYGASSSYDELRPFAQRDRCGHLPPTSWSVAFKNFLLPTNSGRPQTCALNFAECGSIGSFASIPDQWLRRADSALAPKEPPTRAQDWSADGPTPVAKPGACELLPLWSKPWLANRRDVVQGAITFAERHCRKNRG